MIIQANIGDNEIDFFLDRKENDDGKIVEWKGIGALLDYWNRGEFTQNLHEKVGNLEISFIEADRIIKDLKVSKDITTSEEVILERIMEGLNEYYNSLQSGLDIEKETGKPIPPYDPEKIKVRPMNLSAFEVTRYIQKKTIKLDPEFQRNFVWDNTRKSRLIESMLLKIPLPAFYFWEDRKGNFEVIDGLQRLTVINEFLSNHFKLRNLQYLGKECEGCYFESNDSKKKALSPEFSGRVERTQLNINVIESGSPENVKYEIFSRINTGGRPLNNQEIRNCFANPDLRNLLKEMVNNPIFKEATGGSISDVRMDAQELALRFIAFYLFRDKYKGDMEPLLNDTQDELNKMVPLKYKPLSDAFLNGLRNSYQLFGKYTFRKCLPMHLEQNSSKQLINKSLFLTWTITLANVDLSTLENKDAGFFAKDLAQILLESSNVKGDYSEYFRVISYGTGDKTNLDKAFDYAEKFLKEIVGINK